MSPDSPKTRHLSVPQNRLAQFFFMHVGSFIAVFVYFILCERAAYSPTGVRSALLVGLVVMSGYILVAYSRNELKQFDYGLWTMFALGTFGSYIDTGLLLALFQRYSPAVLFFTLGLVALIPLLLGRETFTYYFARRQTPRWQQKLPVFKTINRIMTVYWALVFFAAASLCMWSPQDWRFTALYPNLLIFVIGLPATFWLPPLYLALFPPAPPQSLEPLLMGMPFVFDRKAAKDAHATIQFHVSGAEAGAYYLRITPGKCESFEGASAAPDLTISTPDTVWLRIARGDLDGAQALQEGLYSVQGDFAILTKMKEWFSHTR
jgi:hypothetical protein